MSRRYVRAPKGVRPGWMPDCIEVWAGPIDPKTREHDAARRELVGYARDEDGARRAARLCGHLLPTGGVIIKVPSKGGRAGEVWIVESAGREPARSAALPMEPCT